MRTSDEAIRQAVASARQEVDDTETQQLFEFYERLLTLLADGKARVPSPTRVFTLPEGRRQAAARLSEGQPLLTMDSAALAAEGFGGWLGEVRTLLAERDLGLALETEGINEAEAIALAQRFFDGGTTDEGSAVDALISNALLPWLERSAEQAEPLLDAAPWEAAYCPVCGGRPDFAALSRNERRRTVICERCRTEWTVPTDFCLVCGEDDPEVLGYFASPDDAYRVEVCDSCGGYIKLLRRAVLPDSLLAAERLLTPGLDVMAVEEGYERPVGWEV